MGEIRQKSYLSTTNDGYGKNAEIFTEQTQAFKSRRAGYVVCPCKKNTFGS